MNQSNTGTDRESTWQAAFQTLLDEGTPADQEKVLEFLGHQDELTAEDAGKFLPILQRLLLDAEPRIRYFARKARNAFSKWNSPGESEADVTLAGGNGDNLTTKEILLRKMRLGSRYVSFEAMERLTESGDVSLGEPLLQFLDSEADPFKISFLVKRIGRIPDPRIPQVLATYFEHSDPRIVANALEGIWGLSVPELTPRLKTLAESPDNRIRANAIRALFHYAPADSGEHIERMLDSRNPAWQDSAVFLLKVLDIPHHENLREKALNSPFAGIRLRALEIPKISGTASSAPPSQTDQPGSPDQGGTRDRLGLVLTLLIAGLANFYFAPRSMAVSLAMGLPGLIALILVRNRHPVIGRIALSLIFLAISDRDGNALLLIPIFLVIWTGISDPTGFISSKAGFFAGLFAITTLLLANLEFSRYLQLSQGLEHLSGFLGKSPALLNVLTSHKRTFFTALFVIISSGTLLIANFERWFPPSDHDRSRSKLLYLIPILGIVLVLVCHLAYNFSIAAVLAGRGLTQPREILKFLSD